MKNYFKWVSDSGYLAEGREPWAGMRGMNTACQPLLGNLCWKRLGNAFRSKKTPNLLNFTFLLSLPAQIPASAQQTQWDFGQERAGFSPKAPVLQLHIYLPKRLVWYPCAGRLLGNSHKELEYLLVGLFWKLSINSVLFWLVDGFIICNKIRTFFASIPCAPTNGLCQFLSVQSKGALLTRISGWSLWGGRIMGLQSQGSGFFPSPPLQNVHSHNKKILKILKFPNLKLWRKCWSSITNVRHSIASDTLKPEAWLSYCVDNLRPFLLFTGFQSPLHPCSVIFLASRWARNVLLVLRTWLSQQCSAYPGPAMLLVTQHDEELSTARRIR